MVAVRPFSEFFGGVCCGFCDARSPIFYKSHFLIPVAR